MALLMPGDIVISLEIIENREMGNRGSKSVITNSVWTHLSLKHRGAKNNNVLFFLNQIVSVKEQRVDGCTVFFFSILQGVF